MQVIKNKQWWGLLAVIYMHRNHKSHPPQLLESESAHHLLRRLWVARQLPGAIVRDKQKIYGSTTAYSVGKPDFDYHTYLPNDDAKVAERKRLRVVERWFGDAAKHGVVNVYMSYIYRTERNVNDVQVAADAVAAYVNGGKGQKGIIIEDACNEPDKIVGSRLALGFMANGRVLGRFLSRYAEEVPFKGGFDTRHQYDMEMFYADRTLYEEDYRHSVPVAYDIGRTITELNCFIQEERQLASLRTALQG